MKISTCTKITATACRCAELLDPGRLVHHLDPDRLLRRLDPDRYRHPLLHLYCHPLLRPYRDPLLRPHRHLHPRLLQPHRLPTYFHLFSLSQFPVEHQEEGEEQVGVVDQMEVDQVEGDLVEGDRVGVLDSRRVVLQPLRPQPHSCLIPIVFHQIRMPTESSDSLSSTFSETFFKMSSGQTETVGTLQEVDPLNHHPMFRTR